MKKMYYSLFVILVCFIGIINAKALTVQFNGSAFSGGTTTTAENCWQYGCRTSNAGVKVTVKYKKNGTATTPSTKTFTIDADSNSKINFLGESVSIKKDVDDFTIVNTKTDGAIEYDRARLEFITDNIKKVNSFKDAKTYKYFLSNITAFDISDSITKKKAYNYLNQLKETYIFLEPIIKFTMPNKDVACSFKNQGLSSECLTDTQIDDIKKSGVGQLNANGPCDLSLDTLKKIGFASSSDTEETKDEYCKSHYDAGQQNKWSKFKTAWNIVISGTRSTESHTLIEWANKINNGSYSYLKEGTLGGSSIIQRMSKYMLLKNKQEVFESTYKKPSQSGTTSWSNITEYSGYGLNIISLDDFIGDITSDFCIYENGEIIAPDGKEPKDCCEYDYDLWNGNENSFNIFKNNKEYYYKICPICKEDNYNDLINYNNNQTSENLKVLKKNLPEKANDDTLYCCYSKNYTDEQKNIIENKIGFVKWTNDGKLDIDYCKGNTNNDKYCVWNGNNTERYQTVNGNELDCCIYENWGNTNKEREQALKKANKNKTVTKYVFENETTWYSNTCAVPVPQYCTIQKLQNGDTSCCHQEGLNKWSPSFRQDMRSDGYADTPAGLEEYLKYKIGVNKYNRLCGKGCTYEIESLCPSCDNEDTSYGLVMDTVGGSDSTALQLSNETEQCIFKNNEYLYEKNSYCEVYCTEKLEYSFPKKSTLSVTAGTRLVVGGNLSPMESKSTITCRRTEINTTKFESDLKDKIDKLKAAYKDYTYASVPLNENKIILHKDNATHVSRSEWDCDCKNNVGRGIIDDHICCESVAYEDAGSSHGRLVVAATYTSFDATPIYNDCYGGEWKILSHTTWSEDNCGQDGASDPSTKRAHKNECKLTKPDPNPSCVGGHRERTGFESCGSGYSLVGEQCVPDSIPGCSKSGGTVTCKTVSCDSSYGSGLTKRKLVSTYSGYTTSLSNSMCTYAYCSSRNYERYDYQTVDAYRYGYNKSEPQSAQGKVCENESGYYQTKYENLKAIKKQALLAAWNDYNNVINNLNICYNFTNKVKSNYEININLNYENGDYSINTLLDKTVSTSSDKNFTQTESTRGYKNCGIMTGIEFLNCEQETKYYQENINGTYAAGTSTNTYSYTLPNNSSMYRYVNKSSLSEKDSNVNSIYIGPHLPVAYNEKSKKIEVELTPSVIKSNLSGTTYITKQRNNFESEICTDPYTCDAVTPGKTKIIPVYRVISLNNPFPDEDGTGRNTGKNWCNGSDCTNNNQVVQNVIKNNRGVSEDKVYTLTPLYTLVLTPGSIKKIREYNSQTSYGDYSLICEKDTGKYCKSLYLRGEPDKEGNIINNNLDQLGVLKKDKSCAFNEELAGCMPGDKYEG